MATKIPDLSESRRPAPQPGTGVARYRGAIPDLEAPGEAQLQSAKVLNREGEQLWTQYKHEQDKADTLRAEEAFTKLREAQLDLTVGKENGYTNLKGSQVTTQPVYTDWGKKFDDQAELISGGLANDAQREKFKHRAGVGRLQFNEGLARYVAHEGDRYSEEVFKGTVATETRQAVASWNDPMAVGLAMERIDAATKTQAERLGWPPEFLKSKLLDEQGKVHSAVILQALASNDYQYAQKWYDAHRDQVDVQTAKVLDKAVEDGTQKQLTAGYNADFLASKNDNKALRTLHETVLKDPQLDETRRNVLVGRLQTQIDRNEMRAERESLRQERVLGNAIKQVNAVTLAGFEPTIEQMALLVSAAKGTAMEGEVQQMVATANATRAFRQAAPQQQEAYLTQLEAQARKDPTKFDVTVISKFRSIYENQQKAVKDDPVTFAARQGQIDANDPAAKPLDLSKPADLGPQLAARFDLARSMAARYPGTQFKPLTKEEVDTLSASLKSASPEQKRQYFAALYQSSGSDMDGNRAIMAQIAPNDPVTAIGGVYAGRGLQEKDGKITAGRGTYVSDLIFRGQSLLNPDKKTDGHPQGGKLWPMPSQADEKKMDQLFNGMERDAFAGLGPVRANYFQASKAIYAALSERAGDSTGVLDSTRWEQSITLATGGFDRWNSKNVILPYGHDPASFRDGLRTRVDAVADRLPDTVTRGKLMDLPLEPAGDGKYVFRTGDNIVLDKSGRPIVIDFNQPLPYVPSGHGREAVTAAEQAEAAAAARLRPTKRKDRE